ncbi:MAG: MbtH family NRPS accessory protein [Cyanobacteria bacterium J06626_23]
MTESTQTIYRVVISDEGRYSIWPEYKEIPWGWRAEGKVGPKQDCLDYIAEVWTDMRPLSLQKAMAEQETQTSSDAAT